MPENEARPQELEYGVAIVRALLLSLPLHNLPEDVRASYSAVRAHYITELLDYTMTALIDMGYDRAVLVKALEETAARWKT